jgi:hypothetical protein
MRPRRRASGRTLLLALLAGLALGAGGRLYLRYYEPEVEHVEVGWRGEAATNPLLAAERLLRRLGYPVHRCDGELGLPPHDHLLIMLNRSELVTRFRKPELLRWMRQGGRLIVTPAAGWWRGVADPLLAEFGVKVKSLDVKQHARTLLRVRMALEPVQDHGSVRMYRGSRLVDTRAAAAYRQGDKLGSTVLVFGYGKGELTVLSSELFLNNSFIGQDDNAAFLLWLVLGRGGSARRPTPRGIELSSFDEMPALVTLLAQYGWTALVPALLLVASIAWRATARFGPLLPDPPQERRGLLEHLGAAARWLWHGDHGRQRPALVEGVRRALRQRLEARRPAWSKLAGPELSRQLGAASGLAPRVVSDALYGPAVGDEVRFLTTMRTLALLRRSL